MLRDKVEMESEVEAWHAAVTVLEIDFLLDGIGIKRNGVQYFSYDISWIVIAIRYDGGIKHGDKFK